jgi:hypothetical protein
MASSHLSASLPTVPEHTPRHKQHGADERVAGQASCHLVRARGGGALTPAGEGAARVRPRNGQRGCGTSELRSHDGGTGRAPSACAELARRAPTAGATS